MGIFSVGVSGLGAAQAGILTASHNIANASTPGYSRQEIVQGTNIPMLTGAGFQGQGTHVQTVKRVYDAFLGRQVLSAEASATEMDSYLAQITQIDNLLADPNAGLSPALAAFFKGVQEVAANPASIPGRQSMLSASQALVARFQSIDQRLGEIRDGVNSQIMAQVTSLNTYATQLADMNQRIIQAQAGSQTQAPNDLLDQREQMLKDLNKIIRVSTLTQSDGSFNVFIGNGQPLVVGTQPYQLQAVASREDPERIVVAMTGTSATPLILPDSQIAGGALGGLVTFRSQSLDAAQNGLGRIALTLAQNFNDQHKLGTDLTGALGQKFFSFSLPAVFSNTLNTGAGLPQASFDSANIDELTTSDYRLSYDGTNYQLTRLADSAVVWNDTVLPVSPTQSVDGLFIDSGTWVAPLAGDSFLIQPARQGARNISTAFSDARLIAAAAPVRTSMALTNTGTGSIDAGTVTDTTNAAFATFNTTGQLAPPVLIQFDNPPTTYTVYDNTVAAAPVVVEAGITYTVGADIFPTPGAVDYGYRIKIRGSPTAGDKFTVEGNKNGVADNRNAMLLGALQTKTTMNGKATAGPTASYQSAYSQIVSSVGSKANEVAAIGASQQTLVDHATQSLQQISGVNLDEEAANLLRYQQAYQASAKILATAAKVFEELLTLGQ
ncbi:MAG: flagellar hook-associated protein FlgK [Rhodocyclales bacterium RIFCSPLOWO2_02_FULL_63_24]|nr:MAG: flagellar hook-associated protein FlgK [Rhodocyclales bacterium RIFCSPLOWO2_02_FULL_63_24]